MPEGLAPLTVNFDAEDLAWAKDHGKELERPVGWVVRKALAEYRANHQEETTDD